jgi:hypothetical protein
MSGQTDAFLIRWAQTRIDGEPAGPCATLIAGARWQWDGRAVDVPGFCQEAEGRIGTTVSRLLPRRQFVDGLSGEDPQISADVLLTDGTSTYRALRVDLVELARPVLLFVGVLPPRRTELVVLDPLADPVPQALPAPTVAVAGGR